MDTVKLWNNALKVVENKKQYQENIFKELLEEGYQKGLIAGRSVESAKIALDDFFNTRDKRWDIVAGVPKDRLIEEAVRDYTDKHEQVQMNKEKRAEINDNSASFFRLYAGSRQHTFKVERENARQEELLLDELALLSVHRNVRPNPTIHEDLYVNGERVEAEDMDHGPLVSRRRARDRSVERLQHNELTDQSLRAIMEARGSPEKAAKVGGQQEAPTDLGTHTVCLLFQDTVWKPPHHFEMQLRNRLEELHAPYTMDMPCRIRRLGKNDPGMIVEMRGSKEKCQAISLLKGINQLVVSKQTLTRVWDCEAVDDPLGELVDYLTLHYNSLTDAWQKINHGSAVPLDQDLFKKRFRKIGFMGDLKVPYHALDDGMFRITPESFQTLEGAVVFAHVPGIAGKKDKGAVGNRGAARTSPSAKQKPGAQKAGLQRASSEAGLNSSKGSEGKPSAKAKAKGPARAASANSLSRTMEEPEFEPKSAQSPNRGKSPRKQAKEQVKEVEEAPATPKNFKSSAKAKPARPQSAPQRRPVR